MPTFDPDGKYLYVLTNRTFKPIYSDLDNTWIYANTTNVAAIALRKDVASPLAPRNDVEGEDAEKDDKDKDEGKDKAAKGGKEAGKDEDKGKGKEAAKEPPKPVEIDLDGFEQRLVVLPAEAGNYAALAAIAGKVIYRRLPRTGAADETEPARLLGPRGARGEDGRRRRRRLRALGRRQEAAGVEEGRLRHRRRQGGPEDGEEARHR